MKQTVHFTYTYIYIHIMKGTHNVNTCGSIRMRLESWLLRRSQRRNPSFNEQSARHPYIATLLRIIYAVFPYPLPLWQKRAFGFLSSAFWGWRSNKWKWMTNEWMNEWATVVYEHYFCQDMMDESALRDTPSLSWRRGGRWLPMEFDNKLSWTRCKLEIPPVLGLTLQKN